MFFFSFLDIYSSDGVFENGEVEIPSTNIFCKFFHMERRGQHSFVPLVHTTEKEELII